MAKLIYPDGAMSKEDVQELLEYCIECRRRVKEQLRKMNPAEFSDVALGYIDLDTEEEFIVDLPEVATSTLVYEGPHGVSRAARILELRGIATLRDGCDKGPASARSHIERTRGHSTVCEFRL